MRLLASLIIGSVLFILPPATAHAQYEGTDARYREERRAQRRWNKLIGGGIAIVLVGGAWTIKKIRGKA